MNRLDDFDEQEETGEQAQAPAHIWLRYATQFTSGERSYTIDIGIPVPLGADAQTREQLLREADAGLDQLADYVERRVMQVAQHRAHPSSPSRPASPPIPAPTPTAAPTPISLPASTPAVQSTATASTAGTTSSTSKPQTPAASTPAAQAAPKKQPAAAEVPSNRPNIGASMPPSPGLPSGTLPLPEFLKYLKEMGLDARRAMTLLKVKSLSGLNLREALEQLQHILMQEGEDPASHPVNPAGSSQAKVDAGKPAANAPQSTPSTRSTPAAPPSSHSTPTPVSNSAPSRQGRPATPTATPPVTPASRPSTNSGPSAHAVSTSPAAANGAKQVASEPQPLIVQERKPPYPVPVVFDEEEDEADLEDLDFDEDEEEQESSFGTGVGLSAANRGSAEDIVSRLREAGGSSAVSPQRLKALHNVVDGQLTPEQLQALIRGVWGAASEKKLKGDQAEALISWGKQDEFVTEAEMLLALFEENGNASSNR